MVGSKHVKTVGSKLKGLCSGCYDFSPCFKSFVLEDTLWWILLRTPMCQDRDQGVCLSNLQITPLGSTFCQGKSTKHLLTSIDTPIYCWVPYLKTPPCLDQKIPLHSWSMPCLETNRQESMPLVMSGSPRREQKQSDEGKKHKTQL